MTSRFARLRYAGLLLSVLAQSYAQAPGGPLPQNPPANPPPNSPLSSAPSAPNATVPAPAPVAPSPAASATKTANGTDDEMVSLKLPDADIDTVLSALEIYTGKIILRPAQLPTAPGGYNLKISKPIPKSQAILYLETILAMNNIAVIPMGTDALKIVQLTQARVEAPDLILDSTLNLPASSKVASKVFILEFLRVQEFQQMLGTVTNPNFGQAVPLTTANAVLVTDTISNLQRIETLLQQVDRPSAGGMTTKFYQLHNGAKASDVVAKIRGILTGSLQQQIGQGTSFSPDDRTNQVILISDQRQFPFFDELIRNLDVKADPNTRNEVIYLKHAKASDLASVLINIIRGQSQSPQRSQSPRPTQTPLQPTTPTPPSPLGAPAAAPTPQIVSGSGSPNAEGGVNEFSSIVTIVNDDRSNSIVVSGTLDDIRLLGELIDKLDIVLAQVRIEVVIAEVTLDDNHDSGISQLGLQVDGDRLIGFTANAPGINVGGATDGSFAAISRIGGPGSLGRSLDLVGIVSLSTTPRKNNTTILTVPAVVTSHGKQAIINDGETRPVITGVTSYQGVQSAGSTSSQVTQQQIGTTLTVTPFIGNDGTVQLDIQQELTDVIGEVKVDNNTQYRIGTRKTTSYITAKSGEIIVLGGFRKDIDSKTSSRLGPIPIIGDLLGGRHKEKYHQELIFFLRPMVLTGQPTVDNAETFKRMDRLPTKEQIKQDLDPNYQPTKKPLLDKILPR